MTPARVVRAAYGAFLLLAPRLALRPVWRGPPGSLAEAVARLLGARHVAQAVLVDPGDRTAATAGAVVDVLHSLSMLGLAVRDPRRRVAALASATVAGSFAVDGVVRARTDPAHGSADSGVWGGA